MKKKILITGGAGFIGTNLASELRGRGHFVFCCDLYNTNREKYVRCDVRSHRQLSRVFDEHGPFDFVYHLAAEYGRWNGEAYYENLWETNVIGTKNLLRLQESLKFKLIFFSSAEVYGDFPGTMAESVMENSPIGETYQMNDYAISKWAGELMCLNATAMFGSQIVRTRPVNCYGPHEEYTPYRGFVPKFIYQALNDQPLVVHSGHKRIVDYVGDSCVTWANIVDNFKSGEVYNVGGRPDWEMDVRDVAEIVIQETGKSRSLIRVHDEEGFTTKVKTMSFERAERDLGHNPVTSPRDGIRKTVAWMRNRYGLS